MTVGRSFYHDFPTYPFAPPARGSGRGHERGTRDRRPRSAVERLAEAIDGIGPELTPLFLAKLALLLGNDIGDASTVARLIDAAQRDLP